jgi:hypothetical protein
LDYPDDDVKAAAIEATSFFLIAYFKSGVGRYYPASRDLPSLQKIVSMKIAQSLSNRTFVSKACLSYKPSRPPASSSLPTSRAASVGTNLLLELAISLENCLYEDCTISF